MQVIYWLGKNRINWCYKIPSGYIRNRVIVLRVLSALCWSSIFFGSFWHSVTFLSEIQKRIVFKLSGCNIKKHWKRQFFFLKGIFTAHVRMEKFTIPVQLRGINLNILQIKSSEKLDGTLRPFHSVLLRRRLQFKPKIVCVIDPCFVMRRDERRKCHYLKEMTVTKRCENKIWILCL